MNKQYYQETVLKQCNRKYPVRVILEVESVQTTSSEVASTSSSFTGVGSDGRYNIGKINDLLHKCQKHLVKLTCKNQSSRKLSGYSYQSDANPYLHQPTPLNSEQPAWRNPTLIKKVAHIHHRVEIPNSFNHLANICTPSQKASSEKYSFHSSPIWRTQQIGMKRMENVPFHGRGRDRMASVWTKAHFETFSPRECYPGRHCQRQENARESYVEMVDGILSSKPQNSLVAIKQDPLVARVMSSKEKDACSVVKGGQGNEIVPCQSSCRVNPCRCYYHQPQNLFCHHGLKRPYDRIPMSNSHPPSKIARYHQVTVSYGDVEIGSSTSSQSKMDRIINAGKICSPCPTSIVARDYPASQRKPEKWEDFEARRKQLMLRCRNLYRNASSTCTTSSETSLESLDEVNAIYCRKCMRFVPNRSQHCPICNVCIDKWYNHSYILGTCIGAENIGFYMMFLFWSSLGLLGTAMLQIFYLTRQYPKNGIFCYLVPIGECETPVEGGDKIISYLLLLYVPLSLYCYLLFVYYLDLVRRDKTSYEDPTESKTQESQNLYRVFGSPWYMAFFFPGKFLSEKEQCTLSYEKCECHMKMDCYMKSLIAKRCMKQNPYDIRKCKPRGEERPLTHEEKLEKREQEEEKKEKRREEFLLALRDFKALNQKIVKISNQLEDTEKNVVTLENKVEKARKRRKCHPNLDQSFIRKMTN